MYDFVRGPLMVITLIVFFSGLIFRIVQFMSLTTKKNVTRSCSNTVPGTISNSYFRGGTDIPLISKWRIKLKNTILGLDPLMAVVSFVFHVILFVAPLFSLAHNTLLDESWGVSLWSLSEKTVDRLTLLFIIIVAFFLFRRIFVSRVRIITTTYDYIVLFITAAPFISGFMAYRQMFDYEAVLIIHILSGEIMLMAIVLTKLAHMPFFFFARFFIRSEFSLWRGNRVWLINS